MANIATVREGVSHRLAAAVVVLAVSSAAAITVGGPLRVNAQSMAILVLTPSAASPGQTVQWRIHQINGTDQGPAAPGQGTPDVVLHWDAADGPELDRASPANFDAGGVNGSFKVPANAATGAHLVWATEAYMHGNTTFDMPQKTAFYVTTAGGSAPAPAKAPVLARSSGLDENTNDIGVGALLIVALVSAVVAVAIALSVAAVAGRQPRAAPRRGGGG